MSNTVLRRFAAAFAFALAFVMNPGYVVGCAASTDPSAAEKAAAEAQLLADLDEINAAASWTFNAGDEQYELLLELTQQQGEDVSARAPAARWITVAHACGQHTFYQSASACDTYYELAIEGTLALRRLGASPATIASEIRVRGVLQDYGDVSLTVGEHGELHLSREAQSGPTLRRFVAQDLGEAGLDLSFDLGT